MKSIPSLLGRALAPGQLRRSPTPRSSSSGLIGRSLCRALPPASATTDPLVLAFARQSHPGSGCAVIYATAYPFTVVLRIVTTQSLAFILS